MKNGVIKHVNLHVKVILQTKKVIFGILAQALAKVVFNKYCWYFSDCVWWNCICYGYCINKNDKYHSNKCINKLS